MSKNQCLVCQLDIQLGVNAMNNTYKIGLVTKTYSPDAIGNRIESETISYVFADVSNVSAKEFFESGQNGLKADSKFTMRDFEYSEQNEIVFNETRYSVYRFYKRNDGFVELFTEKKVGV